MIRGRMHFVFLSGIRRGCTSAFTVERPADSGLVCTHRSRRRRAPDADALASCVPGSHATPALPCCGRVDAVPGHRATIRLAPSQTQIDLMPKKTSNSSRKTFHIGFAGCGSRKNRRWRRRTGPSHPSNPSRETLPGGFAVYFRRRLRRRRMEKGRHHARLCRRGPPTPVSTPPKFTILACLRFQFLSSEVNVFPRRSGNLRLGQTFASRDAERMCRPHPSVPMKGPSPTSRMFMPFYGQGRHPPTE